MKNKFNFYNFPKIVSFQDYQEAKDCIINDLIQDHRVVSLYSFGSVVEKSLDAYEIAENLYNDTIISPNDIVTIENCDLKIYSRDVCI